MFFSRWFSGAADRRQPIRGKAAARGFKPAVDILEDRTVPTTLHHPVVPLADPATHLQVIVPQNVTAGKEFDVEVVAEDASNHVAKSYTGTVQITLAPTDPGATLPANYTFKAADHGVHFFDLTLAALGSETVTATDTVTATITGSAATTVNAPPPATHFKVVTPHDVLPGIPANVTVIALDAANHIVPGYTGTVSLTSSDGKAVLPGSYTFSATDDGQHTFQVTLETTGAETVTATDAKTATITGSAATTVDVVGAATHFAVYALPNALTGSATQVEVVALDAKNHQVAAYTGTVHFTSSDTAAGLPADYTFVAGDAGAHIFNVTFNTAGKQTVTATDTVTATVKGTAPVHVVAQLGFSFPVDATGTVTHFAVLTLRDALTGYATEVRVVALDAANHQVANYTGIVHFTSSDGAASLPADYMFTAIDAGSHVFTLTLATAGRQTVTTTDTVTVTTTGTGDISVVSHLPAKKFGGEHHHHHRHHGHGFGGDERREHGRH